MAVRLIRVTTIRYPTNNHGSPPAPPSSREASAGGAPRATRPPDRRPHHHPRPAPRVAERQGGDRRGEPAREYPRELVDGSHPRVTDAGVEELGPERRQGSVDRGVDQAERYHDAQPDQDRPPGIDQQERGKREQPEERRARTVHCPPAEAIREGAVDRYEHHPKGGGDRHPDQGRGPRQPKLTGYVGDYEDTVGVEDQTLDPARAHAQDQLLRLGTQQLHEWYLGLFLSLPDTCKRWGLQDLQSNVYAYAEQHDARQERHPPAPGEELCVGKQRNQAENYRTEQEPRRDPDLRPAPVETAPTLGRVLHRHQHRSAAPAAAPH